jgi:CRP-like cAMP-binding protein
VNLPIEEQNSVTDSFEDIAFVDGARILAKGELGSHLYIIKEGTVSVIVSFLLSMFQAE